jgi:hypothetical protein
LKCREAFAWLDQRAGMNSATALSIAASRDSRIATETPPVFGRSPISNATANTRLTRSRSFEKVERLASKTWKLAPVCGQPRSVTSGRKIMETYCLGAVSTELYSAPLPPIVMTESSRSKPLNRMGVPSSIEKATAVQCGASWASVIRGNDFVKFTSQPGRLRMDCSAEIVRTSGVKSTLRLRTELLNSSTSANRNILGAWSGAKASPVIPFFLAI